MKTDATPAATPVPMLKKRGPRRPYPPRQEKPRADFPLTWHLRGYWFKKHRGAVLRYTADAWESLKRWHEDEKFISRGELPPALRARDYEVRDARNLFMDREAQRMAEGEIEDVQFAKYRKEMEEFVASVGAERKLTWLSHPDHGPEIFAVAKAKAFARGLDVAERHIAYVRKMLDLAHERGLMPPPAYGDNFDPPTGKQVMRKKLAAGDVVQRAWSVDELRLFVGYAWRHSPRLFAQVLLALNGAFGADDCGRLVDPMIDRKAGMIRGAYRGKNLRQRLVPLWPMTLVAIDAARSARPKPARPEFADRVFLTEKGYPVARKTVKRDEQGGVKRTGRVDVVQQTFEVIQDRIEKELKVKIRRKRAGFYTLRAMWRTLAVGAGVENDLIAVIKGQKFARPVDEYYLRGDLRAKLFQVTDHVFNQLFVGWSEPWPHAA